MGVFALLPSELVGDYFERKSPPVVFLGLLLSFWIEFGALMTADDLLGIL